jgi:hypothetical protein
VIEAESTLNVAPADMRTPTRISLLALLTGTALALSAPVAQAAFGVEENHFEAGTCTNETCTYASIKGNPSEAYTQAAGHPQFGLTTFTFTSKEKLLQQEPEGAVKNIRVDIPPGLAADPQALPKCTEQAFKEDKCPANTQVGVNELTVFAKLVDTTLSAPVYNLEPPEGLPLEFGIHAEVPAVANEHVLLKGHLSWHKEAKLEARGIASGDYHEYFEINNVSEENPVLKSKLIFKGRIPGVSPPYTGEFLTLPSVCSSTTTSYLEVESWKGEVSSAKTLTPVGVEGCQAVPFEPALALTPAPSLSDEPDGATVEVKLPQGAGVTHIGSSDVKEAVVTLPEGMTLNPSAAHGLEACTSAQIAIGSANAPSCPAGSKLGSVTIETPDLPPGSLTGGLYLGSPTGALITEPPFTVYLTAESARYGIAVRLKGLVKPDPASGRLQTVFTENPELPFSDLVVTLNGGARAPLANPLACEAAPIESVFTPFTGQPAALASGPFASGGCAAPLPFALAQSTRDEPANAGAHAAFTFALAREDGGQYVSQLTTVLPAGLVGIVPSVALCGEPQAAAGTCGAGSEVGTATVTAGVGAEPFSFSGPVYLTGPYNGAPYGLSIAVPAKAGPFDLGSGSCDCVLARAAINVNPTTARVSVTSDPLPRIVKGVPVRLRSISVAMRSSFMLNPTSCAALATETTASGFTPGSSALASASLSSPFGVGNCGALAFTPTFAAQSNAKVSKAEGAALATSISQPGGQANIQSVTVALPAKLVTRLSTLQQACPEAAYAANPASCPAGSNVGSATASTPVLPTPLSGPAYLVSHGSEAFPDLDLLLEGSGVRVVLVGHTNITAGVTRTTFPSLPDVPISSFALNLPSGPHSVLTANGELCAGPLVMPTTILAQSGAQVQYNTPVAVAGCRASGAKGGARRGVKILRRKLTATALILTIRTYTAGRVRCSGTNLKTVSRRLRKASTTTVKLALSRAARGAIRRHRKMKLRVHVSFVPAQAGLARSAASTSITLR